MTLSTKTKESIKTALAMTIAYGIALSLNWDNPYWAGFAVAFISLASVGQSLNKAALRMSGTLLAMVASLTLIALFAQDRWAFMLGLSLVTGICCYMMSGKKHQYFWQATGFITVIICMDAGPDPVNAFQTAMLRAEETGLGILVYSLITIFLWPTSSRTGFDAAFANLVSLQHQLYRACFAMACGQGNEQGVSQLKAQTVKAKASFDQLLNAALTDSYEVWESRDAWRQYQSKATELMGLISRWQVSIAEAKGLDLQRLMPGLKTFDAEIDGRLMLIDQMLAGHYPERSLQGVELSYDIKGIRGLGHFNRAAFAVLRAHMQNLERLTRALFDAVGSIKGFDKAAVPAEALRKPKEPFLPDLDRLANTCRFLVILWFAFLALIYVGDIPGGAGFVTMCGALGIALVNMPQIPVSMLFKPAAASISFAGVIYLFVMPQLSSFFGLGLLLFSVTFAICYLFAAPQQGLSRALGLALFVTVASISNQQTYSFLSVATTALMFPLLFLLLTVTVYFPFDLRPEQVSLRLLSRFFRSSEYLISTSGWDAPQAATHLECWRKAFHAREIAMLPDKLGAWLPHINTGLLSDTSPAQLQELVSSMQSLTYRMQQLLEERGNPQAQFLVEELQEDFRSWRLGIQDSFQNLSRTPVIEEWQAICAQLEGFTESLERRIKERLDRASEKQLTEQDAINFYLLLGACQGVSEALVNYAGSANVIDWVGWREERF